MTDRTDPAAPDTIVLVHGLWMTPRSWRGWKERFEAKGFTVLTPGYPGFEIEVEALREQPELIDGATLLVYEGGAHGLPDTDRERLHADLLAFIDS